MEMYNSLKRSKIVISNGLYWRYSFDYFLASMEKLGVRNIELHGNSSHFPIEYISEYNLDEMKKKVQEYDLNVVNLAMDSSYSYPNIASSNVKLRERTIDIYRRLLYAASEFGAKTIQLLPGRGDYDYPRETAEANACDTLCKICDIASEYEIRVILESTSPHNTNVANSTREAIRIMDMVGRSNIVSMLDFCSVARAEDDFAEAYKALGDRMEYIHMCDGTPMGHLIPGEGELDVDGYLQVLDNGGYNGWLCYEIYHDRYDRDPEESMRRGLEYLYRRMN